MKKLLTVLFFAFFLYVPYALATSGACSYHGGVDCAAGPGYDGSAVCYDGSYSSVQYSQMNECIQQNACTYPTFYGTCSSQSNYSQLQAQLIASGSLKYASTSSSGLLQACQSSINAYQAQISAYNSCVYGANYAPTIKAPEVVKQWDTATCNATYGAHVHSWNNECSCDPGYQTSDDQSSCVAIPAPVSISIPAMATPVVTTVIPSARLPIVVSHPVIKAMAQTPLTVSDLKADYVVVGSTKDNVLPKFTFWQKVKNLFKRLTK